MYIIQFVAKKRIDYTFSLIDEINNCQCVGFEQVDLECVTEQYFYDKPTETFKMEYVIENVEDAPIIIKRLLKYLRENYEQVICENFVGEI